MNTTTAKYTRRIALSLVMGSTALFGFLATSQQPSARIAPASASTAGGVGGKRLAFEIVSIRPSKGGSPDMETLAVQPDGYRAINQPLVSTIAFAYLPRTYSWSADTAPLNQPRWAYTQYDIQARVSAADLAAWQKQGPDSPMLSAMLRSMLEDRFKISVHWVSTQSSGYALVVDKHGPKFQKAVPGQSVPPNGFPVRIGSTLVPGATFFPFKKGDKRRDLPFYNLSMEALAQWLSEDTEAPIVDRTGLPGTYNVILHNKGSKDVSQSDPGPHMKWDLDTLGLKLVSTKAATQRLVIDHIERPSEN